MDTGHNGITNTQTGDNTEKLVFYIDRPGNRTQVVQVALPQTSSKVAIGYLVVALLLSCAFVLALLLVVKFMIFS